MCQGSLIEEVIVRRRQHVCAHKHTHKCTKINKQQDISGSKSTLTKSEKRDTESRESVSETKIIRGRNKNKIDEEEEINDLNTAWINTVLLWGLVHCGFNTANIHVSVCDVCYKFNRSIIQRRKASACDSQPITIASREKILRLKFYKWMEHDVCLWRKEELQLVKRQKRSQRKEKIYLIFFLFFTGPKHILVFWIKGIRNERHVIPIIFWEDIKSSLDPLSDVVLRVLSKFPQKVGKSGSCCDSVESAASSCLHCSFETVACRNIPQQIQTETTRSCGHVPVIFFFLVLSAKVEAALWSDSRRRLKILFSWHRLLCIRCAHSGVKKHYCHITAFVKIFCCCFHSAFFMHIIGGWNYIHQSTG